jgi:hypothetical protein
MGGCSMNSKKSKEVQEGMNAYLSEKYGGEFEFVKKPYLTGNEGSPSIYQAKVIPASKPEMEFFVECDKDNSGAYIDGYLQVKWTYEGEQEVKKKIQEVYGADTDFVLSYTFSCNNEEFKDLNHSEVLAKFNGDVYVNISIDIFSEENFDKNVESEKAYEIMKPFLLDNKINYYDFNVLFFTKEFKAEYDKNPKGNEYGKGKDFDVLYKEKKLINFLKAYNLKKTHPIEVNSSSDLIKWFRY